MVEVMCCEGGCIRGNSTITDAKIAKKIITDLIDKSDNIERKG